jgi:extracellular factor (EF) 3-hydroxypalmitic acid methyl ester biosynthesis protein
MISSDPTPQAGFALLNELADSEISWLRAEGETRYCERGALLVQEGSRIETLYLVLSGVLSVTIGGSGGREIAKLGPGQIIGEMSFLEDRPASATVRALEGSEVLALSRAAVETKLRQDTAFSSHLYRGLAVVTSRRLRNVVGQLGRWLETEPIAEDDALARWSEVARRTQEFKAQIVAAKSEADDVEDADLAQPLQAFSASLDRSIGPDSLETVDAREELGARVQRELLPYFLKARTPAQLFEKPRGYPGDFRAAEMIHANKPDGEHPLGPLLDAAFLALPSMTALRSGRTLLQNELRRATENSTGDTLRITAVAAAPGAELRGLLAAKASGVEATLIEFDDEALAWMRTGHRGSRLRLELESLVNLALGQRRVDVEGQDFVYSLLVSSFSDRFAIGLLNYLHGLLRPGGWACVGCLHPQNPDKTFLNHILGWSIAHRDEEEMHTLFRRSAFNSECERFETEEQGIFYLAACQKA